MKQSKLFVVLESLSKNEWISLNKYVIMESSTTSDIYTLLKYMDNIFNRTLEIIPKEHIKDHLFPEMTDKNFLNLYSRLYIIIEGWLVWNDNKKDKNKCDVQLVKIYNRKGLFNLADQKYNRIHNRLTRIKTSDMETNKLLNELYHYHYFSENSVKNKKPELLIDLVQSHELRYKERSLLYLAQMELVNKYRIIDYSDQMEILKKTLNTSCQSDTTELFSKLYELINDQNPTNLNIIYNSLINGRITPKSDFEFFVTLYGIALSQTFWNKNLISDPKIVLSFYEYGLSSGVLLNLGKLTMHRFIHIITILSKTQKPESCYEFIDKYIPLIEKKDRSAIMSICIAKIKLEERKFTDVIIQLRSQSFGTLETQIEALTLEVMALYEEKEWNLLYGRIHNFKRKLRSAKGKSSRNIIEGQLSFLKVVEKLMNSNYKVVDLDLSSFKYLSHRMWLKTKLEESKILN